MGERNVLEIVGKRKDCVDEIVAALDRAILMEGEKANIVTAVRRLAMSEGVDEAYNEGLNLLACTLAWLYRIRPNGHLEIQNDGLREIRESCA